ncbi:DUF3298 and DUF4163 domain-containing protein [Candidatus Kaiserbacteria bacterium]|nr:DUF3298 and DUF4163 domain-containing protein [Candidatus Kaiserbacteria bacterium]
MNRALVIAAVLVVLGGGYALYKGLTRLPSVSDVFSGARVATATEKEETDTYVVDAKYPQFDIASIDANIEAVVEGALTQFKNDVALGPPPPDSAVSQYEFQSMFDSAYVGPDVVSAKLVFSTYMGGAHGIASIYGLNYDRETGRELTLDDALAMIGLSLTEVAERAKAELTAKLGSDIISPEGADPTPENYATFIVGPEQVTFVFQVYQIAPYAAGPQEVSFTRVD